MSGNLANPICRLLKRQTCFMRHVIKIAMYKVVQIWPGQTVTCLHTNSPDHWTTLYKSCVTLLAWKREHMEKLVRRFRKNLHKPAASVHLFNYRLPDWLSEWPANQNSNLYSLSCYATSSSAIPLSGSTITQLLDLNICTTATVKILAARQRKGNTFNLACTAHQQTSLLNCSVCM
jgi:hypothetical protein